METKRLKRKRRPVGGYSNPLFVKWVEEWRDQAREEGSKVQYAYTKALNSLKKYPLPLTSGEEAKILDHIGEKLAKKLDKRLAQYRAEEEENSGSVKRSKVAARSLAGETSGAQGDVQSAKGKKKRRQTEYVPEFRSGPYAIIIALYRAKQRPNWTGHLTKNQLMSQAQPFSDKSFTIPDDGKYYTAWSSVATLIRKGLVDKRSCPAKFRLTEAGEEMAEKLERATSVLTSPSSVSPSADHSPSSSSSLTASNSNRAGNGPRVSPTQNIVSRPMSPPTFSPPYPSLKSPNTPTPPDLSHPPTISLVSDTEDNGSSSDIEILPPPLSVRIQAKTRPTTTTSLSLSPSPPHTQGPSRWCVEETPEHSVACASGERFPTGSGGRGPLTPAQMAGHAALSRLQSGGVAGGIGRDRGEGNSSGGGRKGESSWKGEESRGERSKGTLPSCRVDLTLEMEDFPVGKRRRESIDDDDDLPDFPLLTKAKPPQTHRPTLTSPPPQSPPFHRSPSSRLSPSPSIPKSTLSKPVLRDVTTSRTQNAGSNTTATTNTTSQTLTTGPPLFRLKPGEFEVLLCVDNAESTACRKSSSQFRGILLQELAKNGVRFDVRKLNVGDFLWIAKEKSSPLRGQVTLPSSREVALDYIVERKRMDDLAGSITDGRFNEQKFRLKNCGVKFPVYLVEEFGDKMHLKLPVRSLEQAISNTLVSHALCV
ncbi:Crossover junction endonuclease MUS81 [Geodia barretti]|uniref:Crossover junction endonuclease MUS81 n=1 Tax=Geodia barretti TaxID=519541 RepID=A0AA35R2N1_GEOBA|nr:Crossover junction endonuclease MUS81 [Geodia barretti]